MYIFKTYTLLFIPIVFFIVAITAPLPVSAAGNDASCLINTAPSSVAPGQTFFAQVDVTNTGSSVWTSGAGYNLGSQSPQDNTRWGTNRVALPLSPFYSGWAYGFSGYAVAPTTPGTYEFAWRMVQDGVEWFGTSCSRTITVTAPPPPPVNGSCSVTHNNCNAGTRGDYLEYSDQWQWWCNGSNGGGNVLCVEMKACTQLTGTPVSCAQYAGQYGIPSNYTVGTASYTYNSCTNVPTYTGGCSPAPAPTASLTINGSKNLTISVGTQYTWEWRSENGISWSSSYTSNDPARCGSGPWVANTERGSDSNRVTSALAGCVFTVNYTVSGRGGTQTDTAIATVSALSAPAITSFTASPTGFSAGGGNVTLSWATVNADSCTLTGDGLNLTRDPRSVISYTIPNRVTRTTTYTLTCSGPGGTTTR